MTTSWGQLLAPKALPARHGIAPETVARCSAASGAASHSWPSCRRLSRLAAELLCHLLGSPLRRPSCHG
jgi:hypothetical protein